MSPYDHPLFTVAIFLGVLWLWWRLTPPDVPWDGHEKTWW